MSDTSETISSDDGQARRSRRGLTAGLAAMAVVAVVAGGGVYAYTMLSSSDEYPYDHLASGAFAYAQTNVDPSAGQKLAVRDLTKKFPEAKDEDAFGVLTADNINAALLKNVVKGDEGFEWAGDRMAFAAYPDDADKDKEPEVAILIQATDAEQAREDLPALTKALNENENGDFVGDVYGDWVGVTDGDARAIFEADTSLADDEGFSDEFGDVEGNVVSVWADLGVFAEALKTDGEDVPAVEGTVTATVEVRDDGVDLKTNMTAVRVGGDVVGPRGDGAALAKTLADNSYDDAFLNLGIAGLGESAKTAVDSTGDDIGVPSSVLPGVLGDQATLSLRGDSVESLEGKLMLSGIDEQTWVALLAKQQLTPETVDDTLTSLSGLDARFELNDDAVTLQLGEEPTGGGAFEDGVVTGDVDLDGVGELVASVADSCGGEAAQVPDRLGQVKFYSTADDEGNGESVISWTTPR